MSDSIKINADSCWTLNDLMSDVDTEHDFTLGDLISAIENSDLPIPLLGVLIQCSHLDEFIEEAKKETQVKEKDDDEEIDYLELYWIGDKDTYEGKRTCSHQWAFHGVGKEGVIPKDILEHSTEEEISKLKEEGWRQGYAIEFSPINELVDYQIKVNPEMAITDWDKDYKDMSQIIKFQPSITLLEVIYSVFWELSYFGSPEARNEKCDELAEAYEAVMSEIKSQQEKEEND